jgi:hypothetical protein
LDRGIFPDDDDDLLLAFVDTGVAVVTSLCSIGGITAVFEFRRRNRKIDGKNRLDFPSVESSCFVNDVNVELSPDTYSTSVGCILLEAVRIMVSSQSINIVVYM